MYRDAGTVPYPPLLRRPAWIFRGIAVILGALLATCGVALCLVLMLAVVKTYDVGDAMMTLTLAPFCLFGTLYGIDLARRASIALSTHRSAFDGRHGKTRAILAGAFGGYALAWAAILAAMVERIEPGVGALLVIVGGVGATSLGAFVHARRRMRASMSS